MKKVILYDLNWTEGLGEQPYQAMDKYNIVFEWGIVKKRGIYLGIAEGTAEDMEAFIVSNEFKCTPVSDEEGIDFFTNAINEYEDPMTWETITVKSQVDNFTIKLNTND